MVQSSCGETLKRGARGQRSSETLVPPTSRENNVPHRVSLKMSIFEFPSAFEIYVQHRDVTPERSPIRLREGRKRMHASIVHEVFLEDSYSTRGASSERLGPSHGAAS